MEKIWGGIGSRSIKATVRKTGQQSRPCRGASKPAEIDPTAHKRKNPSSEDAEPGFHVIEKNYRLKTTYLRAM